MTKDEIIAKLLEHRSEFEAAGITHMSLFGSVARGDDGPESDIDVAVSLEDRIFQSGFGYFSTLESVRERIEDITGRSVDILSEPVQKERLRRELERDRIVAF
ncbi:nucleotidyltransferase family protein [Shinella sp. BYT-45]|uniref:nucleotidyltransferase family protein n=1 Tax=Shinella sp. BYT-45 TaxID=3377377 RepID=UPI003980CC30